MKKVETILIFYILTCAIRYAFAHSSSYWDSFYFICEHGFDICLLVYLRYLASSVFANFLIVGLIIYKAELITYNIVLAFISYEQYQAAKHCYTYLLIFTTTIFIIVVFSKFFDKICITINKLLKWIKH